ncbi:hypothetical protein ACFL51_00915 [Myxococcota bacterium]
MARLGGRLVSGRSVLPKDIRKVRDSVERWRQTRRKRSPMPKELWESAAALARKHGVSPVARALGVDYASLKKHAKQGAAPAAKRRRRRTPEASGFVELSAAQLATASRAAESHRTEVELTDEDGRRLSIRLANGETVDVVGLAEAFLSRRWS